jgi:hypothetical protein
MYQEDSLKNEWKLRNYKDPWRISENDVLIALATCHGKGDIGMSGMTYDTTYCTKGNEYKCNRAYQAGSGDCVVLLQSDEDSYFGMSAVWFIPKEIYEHLQLK